MEVFAGDDTDDGDDCDSSDDSALISIMISRVQSWSWQ